LVDIPPNAKTIQGKMDWQKTNLLSLENIRAGEQIKIGEPSAQIDGHRSVASILLKNLRSVFLPKVPNPLNIMSLPIRLRRDEEEETTSYPSNPNL
jgi:hypothetical protein